MNLLRAVKVALRALAANKLRSVLAVLGIVIGVWAVVVLVAMGQGAQARVEASITQMGVNILWIWPGSTSRGSSMARTSFSETLTVEDAEALEKLPHVRAVAPEYRRPYQVKYMSQNMYGRVVGTTPAHLTVRNFRIDRGEYFDKSALMGRLRVCVLGARMARELFADTDPIGRSLQIDRKNFLVLGVLQDKGGDSMAELDESVYVPVTTALYRLANRRFINQITISVDEPENIDATIPLVEQEMRKLHRISPLMDDDFRVSSSKEMMQSMQEATGALTALLFGIALISLLVGGIGIMNIMLVSVTERTREIGIRRAVGARRRDILRQFLIESMTISLLGGLAGILLGVFTAKYVPKLPVWRAMARGGEWDSVISPEWTAVAFLISCGIGVVAGIYPALKAARLNPVDALRYE